MQRNATIPNRDKPGSKDNPVLQRYQGSTTRL
jgi:hypothetical protein